MKSLELKWGLLIGGANLLWLYLSYYLGMHTNGIFWIQVMSGVNILITLVGFVLAYRELGRTEPGYTFAEGVKTGGLIAVITALIAIVMQFGYFKIVHPDFTDYMVEESRKWAEGQDQTPEEVEGFMEMARRNFSFHSYLVQSAVGALFFGCVFSILISTIHYIRNRR